MWWLSLSLIWTVVAASPLLKATTSANGPEQNTKETEQPKSEILNVDGYLHKHGYLMHRKEHSAYDEFKRNALKTFQRFVGLNVTGVTDEETRIQMILLRCGMKSVKVKGLIVDTNVGKWFKKIITYKFEGYSKKFNESRIAFIKAFELWESVTNLIFIKIGSGTPDIEIRFVKKPQTPCPLSSDGMGGVYAEELFPIEQSSGDMHFDDTEISTEKEDLGYSINLLASALHEIGSSLGLTRDFTISSVMSPFLKELPNRRQNEIDIRISYYVE